MPELPDVVEYLEALDRNVVGETLVDVRLASPFLLRTVDPPLKEAISKRVVETRRLGKRVVLGLVTPIPIASATPSAPTWLEAA